MVTVETPEEFAKDMADISKMLEDEEWIGLNTERAHVRADELMCEILKQLGYGEGVDIFNNMPKWYA